MCQDQWRFLSKRRVCSHPDFPFECIDAGSCLRWKGLPAPLQASLSHSAINLTLVLERSSGKIQLLVLSDRSADSKL